MVYNKYLLKAMSGEYVILLHNGYDSFSYGNVTNPIVLNFSEYELLKSYFFKINQNSFFELLFSDNPIVQEVMSLFLLPINKRLAMKRLQRLRLGKSSVCNAAMLIQEYKKRRLKFPMLVEDKVVYVSKEKFLEQLEDKDIEYMESILKERKFI